MTNIYTIETIILLHKMNILKLFHKYYPVYIVPASYSTLVSYFSSEYKKVYGSVSTSQMSICKYINKELGIEINCLKMDNLPYIPKEIVEIKARNMFSHKKWPHEIVYIEHFITNNNTNDYRLIIDTKSGLSSDPSNNGFILYDNAISIFGLLNEMFEHTNISQDDLNRIYNYLYNNNHTSMTKLSEYYSHDKDFKILFRKNN